MMIRYLFIIVLCLPALLQAKPHVGRKPANHASSGNRGESQHLQKPKQGRISDSIQIALRARPDLQSRQIKLMTTGSPLVVLKQDTRNGFTEVRDNTGQTGWIPSVFVEISAADNDASSLKSEQTNEKTPEQLQEEIQKQKTELFSIRQASASILQIQSERDKLQETVINQERELETLRRENKALDGDHRQGWFIMGAGVLLAGMLAGQFLSRLGWRKKNNWNSF